MGAMTLDVEGWRKKNVNDPPEPVQKISFLVSESLNLQIEALGEELRNTDKTELFLDVEPEALELRTSPECGQLCDCRIRVYLDNENHGHFHLVAHGASDQSLVYSNAVMVAILL